MIVDDNDDGEKSWWLQPGINVETRAQSAAAWIGMHRYEMKVMARSVVMIV